MSEALIPHEKDELLRLETIIRSGLGSFVEVGRALQRIRDGRLYRDSYPTFEEYCLTKWLFKRRYADRLIASAQVSEEVSPIVPRPGRETHARPLAALPPDDRGAAWKESVDTAPGGRVTEKHIRKTIARRKERTANSRHLNSHRQGDEEVAFEFEANAKVLLRIAVALDSVRASGALLRVKSRLDLKAITSQLNAVRETSVRLLCILEGEE